jgi:predicted RNA-binding protein YlqC (UPF0109 family)
MKALVETVARGLVDEPDRVRVSERREGDLVRLELHVAPPDRGRVIGRQGRTAEALRTLVAVVARRHGLRCDISVSDR